METANSHKLKLPAISADSAFRSRSTHEPGYETDLVALVSNGSMVPIPLRLIIGYGFMQHGFVKLSRGPGQFGPVGYEVIRLYIACLAALVIGGSDPFAIDGLVRKRFEERTSTSRIPAAAVAVTRPSRNYEL